MRHIPLLMIGMWGKVAPLALMCCAHSSGTDLGYLGPDASRGYMLYFWLVEIGPIVCSVVVSTTHPM